MVRKAAKLPPQERIQSVDALRGLAVVLMIGHHFLFDLVAFAGAPLWFFDNSAFAVLEPFFAGCFIMLAGVSSRFSRSNIQRGLRVLVAACAVSLVSWLMHMPIWFGILHFLGVAMILYGLLHRSWEKLPQRWLPWLTVLLTLASVVLIKQVRVASPYLWIFGFPDASFQSADYFPLLPWLFVFLFGAWLGQPLKERRLPAWVYTVKPPFFPAVGRHALIIYLLHQPILYALVMLVKGISAWLQ